MDDKLGAGTEARFRAALAGVVPGAELAATFAGGACDARWSRDGEQVARVKFHLRDARTIVFTHHENAPGYRRAGVQTALIRSIHDWLVDAGIARCLIYPATPEAARVFQRTGYEPNPDDPTGLVMHAGPDDRMAQYLRWKDGGPEPGWHKALR